MVRLNKEKVEIILFYEQANRNYHQVAGFFNDVSHIEQFLLVT